MNTPPPPTEFFLAIVGRSFQIWRGPPYCNGSYIIGAGDDLTEAFFQAASFSGRPLVLPLAFAP